MNPEIVNLEQTIDLMLSEVRKSCSEQWVLHMLLSPRRFHRDSFDAGVDEAIEACAFAFKGMAVHLHEMQARHDVGRSNMEEAA